MPASLITTLHAGSLEEIYRRSQGMQLLQSGAFYRIVLLEGRSALVQYREFMK